MTTMAGQCRSSKIAAPARSRLLLTWSISPQAAAAAGLVTGSDPAFLEIEAPWPGDQGPVHARVVQGDCSVPLRIAEDYRARWVDDLAASLVHLDIPGVLIATLRLDANEVQTLYARTSLLETLGIGGGRYEFEGVTPVQPGSA